MLSQDEVVDLIKRRLIFTIGDDGIGSIYLRSGDKWICTVVLSKRSKVSPGFLSAKYQRVFEDHLNQLEISVCAYYQYTNVSEQDLLIFKERKGFLL